MLEYWWFFISKFYSLLSWDIPNQFLKLLFLTFLLDLYPPVVMLLDIVMACLIIWTFFEDHEWVYSYWVLKLNSWMWFQILLSSSTLHGFGRARALGHKSSLVPSNETGWILLLTSYFPKSENENYYALTLNPQIKNLYIYKRLSNQMTSQ